MYDTAMHFSALSRGFMSRMPLPRRVSWAVSAPVFFLGGLLPSLSVISCSLLCALPPAVISSSRIFYFGSSFLSFFLFSEVLEDTRQDMEDWMEGPEKNPFGVSMDGMKVVVLRGVQGL